MHPARQRSSARMDINDAGCVISGAKFPKALLDFCAGVKIIIAAGGCVPSLSSTKVRSALRFIDRGAPQCGQRGIR